MDFSLKSDDHDYQDEDEENLNLADGAWGGENVPYFPFLHREVDVILASDFVRIMKAVNLD